MITAIPAANLPLTTSSRWIGWASSRDSVPWLRSLLMPSKPKAMPTSGTSSAAKATVVTPADALRPDDEQREEQGRRAGQLRGCAADVGRDEVHRHDRGDRDDDEQHEEPDAAEVVGELLAGDRPPAARRRALRAAGGARRVRATGFSGRGHRWPPGRSGGRARAGPSRVAAGGRWTGRRRASAAASAAGDVRSRRSRRAAARRGGRSSTDRTPGTASGDRVDERPGRRRSPTSSSTRWSVPRASSSSGPAATSRPAAKNPTRSHRDWTWPRMCDDSRTVRLRSLTRRRSSASSSSTPDGSIAIVGSSRMSTVGVLDQGVGDAEPLAHAARVRLGLACRRRPRGGPRGAARRSGPRRRSRRSR